MTFVPIIDPQDGSDATTVRITVDDHKAGLVPEDETSKFVAELTIHIVSSQDPNDLRQYNRQSVIQDNEFGFAQLLPTNTGQNTLTLTDVNIVDPRWGGVLRYRPNWADNNEDNDREFPIDLDSSSNNVSFGSEKGFLAFIATEASLRLHNVEADIEGLTLHEDQSPFGIYGIYAMGSVLEIRDSELLGQQRHDDLPVAALNPIRVLDTELTVSESSFQNLNEGILVDLASPVTISESTFSGIQSIQSGGIVRAAPVFTYDASNTGFPERFQGHLEIHDSVFRGNFVTEATAKSLGGIIAVDIATQRNFEAEECDPDVDDDCDAEIPNEPAHANGGNLEPYRVLIEGSTISDNRVNYGHSAVLGTVGLNGPIDAFITGSTISRNISSSEPANDISGGVGGGISVINARSLVVENSTISDNYAEWLGGGIFSHDTERVELTNVTVTNNHAEFQGGGLFVVAGKRVEGSSDPRKSDVPKPESPLEFLENQSVTLVNTIIAGNTAADNLPGGVNDYFDHTDTEGGMFAVHSSNTHDVWFALPSQGSPSYGSHALSTLSANNIIGVGVGLADDPETAAIDESQDDRHLPIQHDSNGNKIGTLIAPEDPKLTPLADYGGNTETHAIRIFENADSPALNAGLDLPLIRPIAVRSPTYYADLARAGNLISESITLQATDLIKPYLTSEVVSSSEEANEAYWVGPPVVDPTDPEPTVTLSYPSVELIFDFHAVHELNELILWGAGNSFNRPTNLNISFSTDGGKTWDGGFDWSNPWVDVAEGARSKDMNFLSSSLADSQGFVQANAIRLAFPYEEGTDPKKKALSEVRFRGKTLHDQRGGPFTRSDGQTDIGAYESPVEYEVALDHAPTEFEGEFYDLVLAPVSTGTVFTDAVDLNVSGTELTLREAILLANIHHGEQTIGLNETVASSGQSIELTRGELQITDETNISYMKVSEDDTRRVTIDASGSYQAPRAAPEDYPGMDLPGRSDLYGNLDSPQPLAKPGERNAFGSRVVNIYGTVAEDNFEVELSGLELTGGLLQGSGGGIHTTEDLILKESVVRGNDVYEVYSTYDHFLGENSAWVVPELLNPSGGGIYSKHAELEILNSQIVDNSANISGGGIHVEQGDLILDKSEVSSNIVRPLEMFHRQVRLFGSVTSGALGFGVG